MKVCFEKDMLPPHVLAVIKRGLCPALVPSSYYEREGGSIILFADTAGLLSAKKIIGGEEQGPLAGILRTIRIMRSICEARDICRDWFIDVSLPSMDPDDVFIDEHGFARLIIKGPGAAVPRDMTAFLSSLDHSLPRLGAGELLAILEQRGISSAQGEKRLIRLLGEVEKELSQ